jgi:integrase
MRQEVDMTLRLVERGGYLYIKGKMLGEEVRKSTGCKVSERLEAERKLGEEVRRIIEFGGKRNRDMKVTDLMDWYEGWLDMNRKLTSQNKCKVRQWKQWAGRRWVSEMNNESISYIMSEYQHGNAPGTIRKIIGFLQAAINAAADHGMLTDKVSFRKPSADDERDEHLTLDEIRAFDKWLKAKHPDYRCAFLFLIDTGARLNEMCRAKWGDVNDGSVILRSNLAKKSKSKTRTIPLSKRLQSALKEHALKCGVVSARALIFASEWDGTTPWENASKKLAKILGEWTEEVERDHIRVHDLRHTFAYQCAKHGCDLGELQRLMGHSDIAMTIRYRGFIESNARSVIGRFAWLDPSVLKPSATELELMGWEEVGRSSDGAMVWVNKLYEIKVGKQTARMLWSPRRNDLVATKFFPAEKIMFYEQEFLRELEEFRRKTGRIHHVETQKGGWERPKLDWN